MTNQHPITPSPELIERCIEMFKLGAPMKAMCEVVAQWGADQELEACCRWVPTLPPWSADDLRRHRRPKPPSLKEQALADLDSMPLAWSIEHGIGANAAFRAKSATIRRALDALPE